MSRNFLRSVTIFLGGSFVILLVIGLFGDRDWEITETIEIPVSGRSVWSEISDLRHWPQWSAWAAAATVRVQDSPGRLEFSGDTSGNGSIRILSQQQFISLQFAVDYTNRPFPYAGEIRIEDLTTASCRLHWTHRGRVDIPVAGFYAAQLLPDISRRSLQATLSQLSRFLVNRGQG